jgi:hypothetical protein
MLSAVAMESKFRRFCRFIGLGAEGQSLRVSCQRHRECAIRWNVNVKGRSPASGNQDVRFWACDQLLFPYRIGEGLPVIQAEPMAS